MYVQRGWVHTNIQMQNEQEITLFSMNILHLFL